MRTFLDAKLMAKTLRDLLAQKNHNISHSEALEIVAQQFGLRNWNILAAKIDENITFSTPDDQLEPLPTGWRRWGTSLECYTLGLDAQERWQDKRVAVIAHNGRPLPDLQECFATLMQTFSPEQWFGKKIALTGMLKSRDAGSVQMWMRIDGPSGILRFDNMRFRPLLGSKDWTPARIVLFVPDEAIAISFGFFLGGTGTAWGSNFAITEATAGETETTGSGDDIINPGPLNLDFGAALA